MAVPPDLVGFVEAAGLPAVPYGPEVEAILNEDFVRNLWSKFFRNPIGLLREMWAPIIRNWPEVHTTLMGLADGADLLSTAINFEQAAGNVAEHYGIPLIAMHHFPLRPNGQLIPMLPSPLVRSGGTISEWLFWRATRSVEDDQRRALGLPKATRRSPRRIAEHRWLEIQSYDAVCVPGLAAEWAKWDGQRPFVGALTMQLTTAADQEVAAWIAEGTPPICFATGSIPVESPADTMEMISTACEELGQRGLVCAGGTDYSNVPHPDYIKVVGTVNYAEIFPACRAVVHHGGAGTTAASLRAGVPALILWSSADQPYWGNQLKRLGVGTARRQSATTTKSMVRDLRRILDPEYSVRARDLATQLTAPADSITRTADLFERAARR
ncbi:putative glycosyltransferase GtfB [Mycolicibacterium moriokaense]|uniref:Glycosyltransferase GtfB n=2 Tax=Mycolicibacterium moriokaense TaxID=39691 RepID=A0AAD1HFJ0_9MYCO|nr:putative glycosyltransferase GtfB [Mycolicibacterium moriokaense]